MAADHLALVRAERARAEAAAAFLDTWAAGLDRAPEMGVRFTPREAAAVVDASVGQIRNWERNNIVETPRDPQNGHRFYTSGEIGRLRVVRTLLLAGYSMTAILRMTVALDGGRRADLRGALDTLRPGEEALTAFDRWLSSLAEQEARAATLVRLLQERAGVAAGDTINSKHF
jgi:DNA-binding transcriptional MerR regulator